MISILLPVYDLAVYARVIRLPYLCKRIVALAAVLAAAMAIQGGTDIRHIDVKALQKAVYPLKEN